jgi:hypothetical protein
LRLRLEQLQILKGGQIEKASTPLELKDRKEISALVRYLLEMHGASSLQPWFSTDLKSQLGKEAGQPRSSVFSRSTHGQAKTVAEMMGVGYVEPWQHTADSGHFYANSAWPWDEARRIAGYDYLSRFNLFKTNGGTSTTVIRLESNAYELCWDRNAGVIELRQGRQPLVALDLAPFLERLARDTGEGSNAGLPGDLMSVEGESDSARIKLRLETVSGTRQGRDIRLTNASGDILVKIKRPVAQP